MDWAKKIEQKKASHKAAGKESIDQDNYINLLIIKPFKAGAKEQKDLLISIDSCPIGRCDNGSPP